MVCTALSVVGSRRNSTAVRIRPCTTRVHERRWLGIFPRSGLKVKTSVKPGSTTLECRGSLTEDTVAALHGCRVRTFRWTMNRAELWRASPENGDQSRKDEGASPVVANTTLERPIPGEHTAVITYYSGGFHHSPRTV